LNSFERQHFLAFGLLLLVTIFVFAGVLGHDFLYLDDHLYVFENPFLQNGLTWKGIGWAFTADLTKETFYADYWQPLTMISRMVDINLYGLEPWGHHFTNLLLHLANVCLLFLLLGTLTRQPWRSLVVVALFAIHPMQVEPVSWVTARKDVLSSFLALLTIWSYVVYTKKASWKRMLITAILFALSLMAKLVTGLLPFLLLLLDVWPLKRFRSMRQNSIEKWPLFCLFGCALMVIFLGASPHVSDSLRSVYPLAIVINFAQYLQQLFIPVHLTVYPVLAASSATFIRIGLIWMLGLFITGYVVRHLKKKPALIVGWIWFLLWLMPAIALERADRYLYFAMIGFWITMVWFLADWLSKLNKSPVIPVILALFVLISCGFLSQKQVAHWHNTETLLRHALDVSGEENSRGQVALGTYLVSLGRIEEATEHLVKAAFLAPDDAKVHNDLANLLSKKGLFGLAEGHYKEALTLRPDFAEAYINYGHLLLHLERFEAAVEQYQLALSIQPNYATAYDGLGSTLLQLGRVQEAYAHFERATQLNPRLTSAYYDWGSSLAEREQFEKAEEMFRMTLSLDPKHALAHNRLGFVLARQGRTREAIPYFREAARLDPADTDMRSNLNLALSKVNTHQPND